MTSTGCERAMNFGLKSRLKQFQDACGSRGFCGLFFVFYQRLRKIMSTLALDKTLVWLEKSLTKHAVEKRELFHRPQHPKRVEVKVVSHVVCLDALATTRRILSFLSIIFLTEKARNHRS